MKSLISIIEKLSSVEIEAFRNFLSNNSKSRNTKKLRLLDTLVSAERIHHASDGANVSRQSIYQLKKRLQDDLYSFLMLQDQQGDPQDQFFREMDCHRKLYCFKILFDRGIHDHAGQILQEVIDTTSQYNIHSLYLEAVNLRNTCFPLGEINVRRSIPISYQLRKLKKTLGRNLYVNQYLGVYDKALHETDVAFRGQLIEEFVDFDVAESENIIEKLSIVNHLFYQRDFKAALNTLEDLMSCAMEAPEDRQIGALINVEATKACICLDDLSRAHDYLTEAERLTAKVDSFELLLRELRLILQLRNGEFDGAVQVATSLLKSKGTPSNQVAGARATLCLLSAFLAKGNFREAVKYINANVTSMYKQKFFHANIRLIELLSIFQLNDLDWLSYKIENFRKSYGNIVDQRFSRIASVVALLRAQLNGKLILAGELDQRVQLVDNEYPWHPLGLEVMDYLSFARPSYAATKLSNRPPSEIRMFDVEV
jgi:hypothetical protein